MDAPLPLRSERASLHLFRTLPGDMAPRDMQDLMAFPFFSLAKSPRIVPIDFAAGGVTIRVEASAEHGLATIWDADILIWAASHIVEARDAGRRISRRMVASPHEILRFIGRGTSIRDYNRLRAALNRLQATSIMTSLRQSAEKRLHRFSWINEWAARTDSGGQSDGVELVLPDWLYAALLDDALVLTIDRAYFSLTGGLERWLYRVVRKHGGHQRRGWRFEFRHLYEKSASLSSFTRFSLELRQMARRQPLPGYRLSVERNRDRVEILVFARARLSTASCGLPVNPLVPSCVDKHVPSRHRDTCYHASKTPNQNVKTDGYGALNLDSNLKESNFVDVAGASGLWISREGTP
ncbi:replication initiator protein A [Komagataeibacter europaeus]|uniref:replication initiator protein A n=1 Tax=Komagataeibacter europaeus TaxID=33995 RepID=UPI000B3E6E24|nr:replication initiator protein A [Komagataeibacter europaeus]ARW15984.1 hypothetical protein S101446_00844 [Komagataeibacter europaeus]